MVELDHSLDLSFVADEQLRKLLEIYHTQGVDAYKAKAYLGALVAWGGVLEGVLTWRLLLQQEDKEAKQWSLSKLIDVAVKKELLGETAKSASWAIKDFRNLIHPYNALGSSTRPDQSLAASALSGLQEMIRSVANRLKGEAPGE